MKFANGYGSITKLSGSRRNPYWVRSAAKKYVEDGKVKTKRQTIGYYKTQKEAIKALTDYNENPYSLDSVTFREIWDVVLPTLKLSEKRIKQLKGIFNNYLADLADKKIKDVRTLELQEIFDNCDKSSATKDNIRAVLHDIYRYAQANDYVSKDYADFIVYENDETKLERIIFTNDEIKKLWFKSGEWYIDLMLILLYTGCRFNEITGNTIDNIDFDAMTIEIPRKLSKNNSSARTIPIHKDIVPLLKANLGTAMLFAHEGNKVNYTNFYYRELPLVNEYLGVNHLLHDTRHTFTTNLRENGAELVYVEELTGHAHRNITDDVYNHISIEKLSEELHKLNYGL